MDILQLSLVKIHIVQPHASIACERGFSAQDRMKQNCYIRRTIPCLELLTRLFLVYRHQGFDLTAESSTPILKEAAELFDKTKKRR